MFIKLLAVRRQRIAVCNRNPVNRPQALFTLPKRHAAGIHTGLQLRASDCLHATAIRYNHDISSMAAVSVDWAGRYLEKRLVLTCGGWKLPRSANLRTRDTVGASRPRA